MTRLFTNQCQDHVPLPPAACERWQPVRGGLLNLYLYDYEEFRYEKGRLILRGNNGTGKSRVMALQLPFLLDGRLASNRVEPDADPSKRMEWNLLMGRHNERLGYTWIEFGRLAPPGSNGEARDEHPWSPSPQPSGHGQNGHVTHRHPHQQFLTLGCGLSATKGSGMREPWFFITDQRIGTELFLQSEAGHALSKAGLVEALGDRGSIYNTAKEYRAAVDENLFGLGPQRYEAMVDLLIHLRKPQLSRDLDEKMLARVLGEALPPPSERMIADVAESFRGLEADRSELNRFRSACDGVDSFLKTYRRYAQIASRRRAADVRHSHSQYESATRDLRQAEREHAEAARLLAAATVELQSLEVEDVELESQIETLRADPKMRSADTIKLAADNEKQARGDFEAARQAGTNASKRLAQRRTAQGDALTLAKSQLQNSSDIYRRASDRAAACALHIQHETAFSGLKLQADNVVDCSIGDPSSMRRQTDETVATRVKACAQLKKRNDELTDAEREWARAKKTQDDAQTSVDQAIESQRAAEEQRRQAVDEFLESYAMWRRDSDDLDTPSEDEIAEAVEAWSERTDRPSPAAEAVGRAELAARQKLLEQQADLQHRAQALTIEQVEAEALAERLDQGFHEPPPLPFGADETGRTARAGAPFWSLVDFAPACPIDKRANIEAALEAAGFLNAWVMPDGSVLTAELSDVLLSAEGTQDVAGRNLSEALRPDECRGGTASSVSDRVVAAVLRKIGYGEQHAPTWVDSDGRWRNGPLHGHCRKQLAQYTGRGAREDHRLRRREAVRADLERINSAARLLDHEHQLLTEKSASIARQVEALPADSAIRSAASAVNSSMQKLFECRQTLTESEKNVTACRTVVDRARETRDLDARDLGLFDWTHRLNELEQHLTEYQFRLTELWPSLAHLQSHQLQLAAAEDAVQEALNDVKLCEDKVHEQQSRHARASQRLKTLQETIGVDAEKILQDLTSAEERRRTLRRAIKQARVKETNAAKLEAQIEERIQSKNDAVRKDDEGRQLACASFQRLCTQGLLQSAGELQEDDASGWSVSRTVEVARQTESAFSHVNFDDKAWDRIQGDVTTTIQELNTALSQHAFTPTLSTSDGLYHVTVPYQGRVRSVHELRELLAEEVRQRQLILDEREREIIENHLIGEVATQLHEQIHRANKLVEQMNVEIQKRPMSTGMMLKFDWKPDEELSSGIVEVCKKLLAATGTWSPAERAAIGRYLQDHIKEVRAAREMGTWHEHLAEALDYRRWHRFWVMRKQDTGWKRLTKRTHGTGSGGEKAVALTIPQFAAAAAHYASARADAPRLILLDEAFVGIDPDMRGKCMELINVFDLDFLMTSEIEWGCYAGLPGVAIHQLSTRSGFDAVFLTRWIWNGKQRVKDDMPVPAAARAES